MKRWCLLRSSACACRGRMRAHVGMCVCVCARARACVRACVRAVVVLIFPARGRTLVHRAIPPRELLFLRTSSAPGAFSWHQKLVFGRLCARMWRRGEGFVRTLRSAAMPIMHWCGVYSPAISRSTFGSHDSAVSPTNKLANCAASLHSGKSCNVRGTVPRAPGCACSSTCLMARQPKSHLLSSGSKSGKLYMSRGCRGSQHTLVCDSTSPVTQRARARR